MSVPIIILAVWCANPYLPGWKCGPDRHHVLRRDCRVIVRENVPDRWNHPECKKIMGF